MARFLALNLPAFSVDRFLRGGALSSSLVVLVATRHGAQHVADCSRDAVRLGVHVGMSLAHAQALLGERPHVVEPWDPVGDRRALDALARHAMRFSPRVALDPPRGLVIDVAGCERLFGGEGVLLDAVVDSFGGLGYRSRAAIADTIGCGWGVSRFARADRERVPSGSEAAALAPLPIDALRLDEGALDALTELGIERVGELLQLPRNALPARFGEGLLLRVDQATGSAFEPFDPLEYVAPLRAEREFESPVELDAVQNTLTELLERLAADLRERGEGALRLELVLACAQAEDVQESVSLSRPSRDAQHLRSLLDSCLERAQLGFGVERVSVSAPLSGRVVARQMEPFGRGSPESAPDRAPDRALGELLDRLCGRLGEASVLDVEPVASHLPERAFRTRALVDPRSVRDGAEPITPLPRPTRLFAPPERIVVEATDDDLPAGIRWRGRERRVVRRFGPERIEEPWWVARDGGAVRDYYRVEDHLGHWLWVGRDAQGRWFLHGEWT